MEANTVGYPAFKRRVVEICNSYPGAANLIESMAGRIQKCLDLQGANIGK